MIRIGTSGWSYPQWHGHFYPKSLSRRDVLAFVSRRFTTIEINATFYGPQPPARFERWYDETPDDFVFAVKAPRQVTHLRRLIETETLVASFFASGLLRLGEKLGPILWQLPPGLAFDAVTIERFLDTLPRDTAAAARFGGESVPERHLHHAIEARNGSFHTPRFTDLLRRYGVTQVFADGAGAPPYEVTAGLSYIRLHGTGARYAGGYGATALDQWASKIRSWAEDASSRSQRDVFVYFNNTMKGDAPTDAMALAERLGGKSRGQSR